MLLLLHAITGRQALAAKAPVAVIGGQGKTRKREAGNQNGHVVAMRRSVEDDTIYEFSQS